MQTHRADSFQGLGHAEGSGFLDGHLHHAALDELAVVSDQGHLVGEALVAGDALVRPLDRPGVCAVLVEDEPLAAHEGFPADPTHVRMPAQVHCVHRIVGVELSPAGKPLAAKRAGVVLLVGPLVYGQSVFPAEALPTHVTLKWPLPRMPPHVDHEALSQRKPFLADVADVGGLAIPGAPPRHSNGSARFVLTWLVFGLVFWWKKLARVGLLFPVAPLVSLDTLPDVA